MKSEQLKEWALFAEIIGGLAVLVTLVFLVIGLRENTELTKRGNFEALQRELRDWRIEVISTPRNLEAYYLTFVDLQPITDPVQQTRWDQLTITLYSIYESAFYFYQAGDLGATEWERFHSRICELDQRDRWQELRRFFTEEFAGFSESCS